MFQIKRVDPPEERLLDNDQRRTTKQVTEWDDATKDDLKHIYETALRDGYTVTERITPNEDPIEWARKCETYGIPYRAKLKVPGKHMMDEAISYAREIEMSGYDYTMVVEMAIDEDSPININHPDTWSEDAKVTIRPKGTVTDVNDLVSVLDNIPPAELQVTTKRPTDWSDDEWLSTLIDILPEGSQIQLQLKWDNIE